MKNNIMRTKSFQLALEVVEMNKKLINKKREFILSKQFLRSGTAVGAQVYESIYAQSRADFVNKLSIGLKECSETLYWIELLHQSRFIEDEDYSRIKNLATENVKLLSSIIVSTKRNSQAST